MKPSLRQPIIPEMEEFFTEQLQDTLHDFLAESTLERPTRLVRNVALLGSESRNGYRYTQEAMEQAVPLYDGRPVFIDHGSQGGEGRCNSDCGLRIADSQPANPQSEIRNSQSAMAPPHRSIRDYAGQVQSPRLEHGRIRGDLRLFEPHADWLMGLFEAAPKDLGMSHVVLARRSKDGARVEHIDRVLSVDIVAFPATTQTFQESHIADRGLPIADSGMVDPPSEIRNPKSDPAAIVAEHDRTSRPRHDASPPELQRLVERSRIPPVGRTAALYQLLLTSADPERVIALVEDCWRQIADCGLRIADSTNPQSEIHKPKSDRPCSFEKPSPDRFALPDFRGATAARRALMEAIRGR